ncbi:uncharacterized protein LOC141913034 [Tubulanus polymorphus]|uniref:uncharacterized protein LOC141913034 n=1 Tax=Tubulanus polymorphus TaxID=672921 RepID=UPI003DA277C7
MYSAESNIIAIPTKEKRYSYTLCVIYPSKMINLTTRLECDEWRARTVKWEYEFSVYLYLGLYGPTSFSGIVLNVFTLIILRRMNNAVYYLIKVLAAYDILYSVSVFFMFPLRTIHIFNALGDIIIRRDDWYYGWEFIYPFIGFYRVFLLIRNWTVVLISFERLVVVLFPLKHRLFWTRKTVNAILFILNVFSLLVYMPNFIPAWSLRPVSCTAGLATFVKHKEGSVNPIVSAWWRFSDNTGSSYLTAIVPMFKLIVINVVLITAMIVSRLKRRFIVSKSTPTTAKEQRALQMAFAIVLNYIACESFTFFDRLYYKGYIRVRFFKSLSQYESTMVLRKIAIGLTVFDSCGNFFIYFLTNNTFKRAVQDMCVLSPAKSRKQLGQ